MEEKGTPEVEFKKLDSDKKSECSSQAYIAGIVASKSQYKFNWRLVVPIGIAVVMLTIGIILIIVARVNSNCNNDAAPRSNKMINNDICNPSDEAKRINLQSFLLDVRESYYDVFPEETFSHPNVSADMLRTMFKMHDPSPQNLKRISDRADELLNKAINLAPDLSKLKPREHKAYLQLKHFLENTFGHRYLKYSAGLWLLGPTSFCTEPMCYLHIYIKRGICSLLPHNEKDVLKIIENLHATRKSIYEYIRVLKMGISKGMVRTMIECSAGMDAFKSYHLNISKNGPQGINGEDYVSGCLRSGFTSKIPKDVDDKFNKKYKKRVGDYVRDLLVTELGKPIHDLLLYLEKEHFLYCRPDDVGPGGLSALPLKYIYYNGNLTANKTDPVLPNCTGLHCRLNGREAYRKIIGYFTTKDIHPENISKLGQENLNKLYPQAVSIAKAMTGFQNNSEAIAAFQLRLNNLNLSYFNQEPLPENETKGDAFKLCTSEETAKIYCPNRWKAMMKWFAFSRMAMSIHDPNTVDFFYFTGEKQSTPSCPVQLRPDFNPSSGAQSYQHSDRDCSKPCFYNIPFFLEDLGPIFAEYSVNAHEARPGHHTQLQGLTEHFRDKCGGPETWLADKTYYTAFTEGWGLYAENPLIAQGTNIYDDNLMQKYGMLQWQIWRALRLIVDTGLHWNNMSRADALELFEVFAWDTSDISKKEVTRYQSNYGQATAYMIGQLDIWKLRNDTEAELKNKFSMKDFHLQALSQGSSPLAYLQSHMRKYIECNKNPQGQFCDIVLNPTKAYENVKPYVRNKEVFQMPIKHYR